LIAGLLEHGPPKPVFMNHVAPSYRSIRQEYLSGRPQTEKDTLSPAKEGFGAEVNVIVKIVTTTGVEVLGFVISSPSYRAVIMWVPLVKFGIVIVAIRLE
jgi:hypothetical protein